MHISKLKQTDTEIIKSVVIALALAVDPRLGHGRSPKASHSENTGVFSLSKTIWMKFGSPAVHRRLLLSPSLHY